MVQSFADHNKLSQRSLVLIKVKSNTKKGYEVATPGDSVNLSQPNSKTRRGRVGKFLLKH